MNPLPQGFVVLLLSICLVNAQLNDPRLQSSRPSNSSFNYGDSPPAPQRFRVTGTNTVLDFTSFGTSMDHNPANLLIQDAVYTVYRLVLQQGHQKIVQGGLWQKQEGGLRIAARQLPEGPHLTYGLLRDTINGLKLFYDRESPGAIYETSYNVYENAVQEQRGELVAAAELAQGGHEQKTSK